MPFQSNEEEKKEKILEEENKKENELKVIKEKKKIKIDLSDHKGYLLNRNIWNCYSFFERFKSKTFSCIKCKPSRMSYVETFIGNPTLSEEDKKILENKCVSIKIIETSNLELDPNSIHPFVRIHIVNLKNGQYIKKSRNSVLNFFENSTTFVKNPQNFVPKNSENILPFSTNCIDLRSTGNSKASWNESIDYFFYFFSN